MEYFNLLNGTYEIRFTVEPKEAGYIRINSINHRDLANNSATYFKSIPINIEAIPNAGYTFRTWVNQESTSNPLTIESPCSNQMHFHAMFD